MKIFVSGNGNISFNNFFEFYIKPIEKLDFNDIEFLLCDFRGTDVLMMEYLKTKSSKVTIYHIGDKPRYVPDKYKTKVGNWKFIGGFNNDNERDSSAINSCSHYLMKDFNSDYKRKSGTLKNIELCESLGKIEIK